MFKKISALAAPTLCAMTFAGSALAGSLGDPIVEAPLEALSPKDWQGFRLGLTYNSEIDGATQVYSEGFLFINSPNDGFDGFGGFLGYDHQWRNLVVGIELQALPQQTVVQGNPNHIHSDLNSLRARIGYAFGNTLIFGSFGLAESTFNENGTLIDMSGDVYGIGVEYMVSDHTFVGLSVDHYAMSGENFFSAASAESDHTIVQLRIGFKF
ncbi:outer membrane beta-barrel protein [Cognatishimia sp. SS12]|uniref:outer membrane protein n=1 Tax=Cognatishimia sp. SS12 TaxID=2979465 RepID=UPI00232C8090|nr:outer membrane beta-barrel protein [Cognatishimia sp. SS12]MDC0737314.1 outer membrane beta-barrel protein [Cognatishimia sp. SS12]